MASRQGAGTPKGKGLLPLPHEALVIPLRVGSTLRDSV